MLPGKGLKTVLSESYFIEFLSFFLKTPVHG